MVYMFTACSQTRILIYPLGMQRDHTEIHDRAMNSGDLTAEQAADVRRPAT